MKHLLILILTVAICSCSKEYQPKDVIDREKFEALYLQLLDSSATGQKDSANFQLSPTAERILARNSVSIEQLRATVNYYNKDTKRWKLFYENVVKKVNQASMKNTSQ